MKIQGAIFDQDGLLFDTESIYQQAWLSAAAKQGIEMPRNFPRQFSGRSPEAIGAMARAVYPHLDAAQFCRDAIDNAWSIQLAGVPAAKPGLLTMLEACRQRGLRTAVASSSTRRVVEHNLTAAGVREYFDAIVTGDDISRAKPAPDIFLAAAVAISLPPAACAVFEDAPSGIDGAIAAGCRAVFIPDQTPPDESMRSRARVYRDLGEAIAALDD